MINQCCICGRFPNDGEPVIQITPFSMAPRFTPFGSDYRDRIACAEHLAGFVQ